MSRKHFIAIAAEIATIQDDTARRVAALAMCAVCKAQNSRFDRARFLRACNVSE